MEERNDWNSGFFQRFQIVSWKWAPDSSYNFAAPPSMKYLVQQKCRLTPPRKNERPILYVCKTFLLFGLENILKIS
jgi:hypothetical protein